MSESSLATVRQLFERVSPERLEAALELVSEDFVAEIPGSMSAEPDVYEGHDGARRYFAGFAGLIEDVRFEPIEFILELLIAEALGAAQHERPEQRARRGEFLQILFVAVAHRKLEKYFIAACLLGQ